MDRSDVRSRLYCRRRAARNQGAVPAIREIGHRHDGTEPMPDANPAHEVHESRSRPIMPE